MSTLKDILLNESHKARLVDDCVKLIDTEVSQKSGLSGLAIKGIYSVVKTTKPSMIEDAVENLLEPFASRLEPFFSEFRQSGQKTLEIFFDGKKERIANALLAITDERAEKSDHKTLKKAYEKLRPTGLKHVEEAVPGIARVIAKYV
jgi:hypothetical protein